MPVALLRHGDVVRPDSWPEGRHYVGQLDLPLSEAGRAQARAWAVRLLAAPPACIHCSDLSRTAETAAILAKALQCPVRPDPVWREIFLGDWEGRSMEAIRRGQPALHAARGADPAGVRPPGGEHFGDLARRVLPAFQALEAATPAGQWSLAVTHAGVIRVLRLLLTQRPLDGLFAEPVPLASLHRLRPNPSGVHYVTTEECPLPEPLQARRENPSCA